MNIIKIPYGEGGLGKTLGSKDGPNAIVEELDSTYLSEDLFDPQYEISEVPIIKSNISENHKRIYEKIKDAKNQTVILGGDHSITYSTFKAFSENNPESGIIIFDAHPDLATTTDVPSHEDYLTKLIEDKIVDPSRIILVGIRNIADIERDFIKKHKIKSFTSKQLAMNGIENVCDEIMRYAKEWKSTYLSIDIDFLDPSVAPGTNHLEAGGFQTRELLYLIHRLKFLKTIKMADIVEIDPNIDLNGMTSRIGARLVKEIF